MIIHKLWCKPLVRSSIVTCSIWWVRSILGALIAQEFWLFRLSIMSAHMDTVLRLGVFVWMWVEMLEFIVFLFMSRFGIDDNLAASITSIIIVLVWTALNPQYCDRSANDAIFAGEVLQELVLAPDNFTAASGLNDIQSASKRVLVRIRSTELILSKKWIKLSLTCIATRTDWSLLVDSNS